MPLMPTIQPVPPAQGSLVQAWVSLATRFARENFAAWSQITTRNWIIGSILTALAIVVVGYAGLIAAILVVIRSLVPASYGDPFANVGASFVPTIISFAIAPISYVAGIFVQALGLALFMPQQRFGPFKARFARVLRPIALAQVGIAAVQIIFFGIGGFVAYLVLPHTITSTNQSGFIAPLVISIAIFYLFLIIGGVYSIMMQVQAGSVGSGFSRWAVFGINLLSGIVLSIVVNIVTQVFSGVLQAAFFNGH